MLLKTLVFSALSVANVTSVTIHAGSGGLGPGSSYQTAIVREGSSFERSDGRRLPFEVIAALQDALQRPPTNRFDFSRTGLTVKDLVSSLPTTEGYLRDGAAIPQVRALFESQYFDFSRFERWVWKDPSSCLPGRMLDYYPRLTVDIRFTDGHEIGIHSESANAYMLPLQISDGATTTDDCDPGLSLAIAALMPEKAATRATLAAETLVLNYGNEIADGRAVKDAVARYGITVDDLMHSAQRLRLSIDYAGGTRKPPEWDGDVYLPDMPQVRWPLPERSTATHVRAALSNIKTELIKIGNMRWLRNALVGNDHIRVRIVDSGPYRDGYADELLDAGRPASALLVMRTKRELAPPLMWIADQDGLLSRWFLLDDGDAMLYDFDADGKAFAFSKAWYARIPHVRSSTGWQISGVIVHPNGESQTPMMP